MGDGLDNYFVLIDQGFLFALGGCCKGLSRIVNFRAGFIKDLVKNRNGEFLVQFWILEEIRFQGKVESLAL